MREFSTIIVLILLMILFVKLIPYIILIGFIIFVGYFLSDMLKKQKSNNDYPNQNTERFDRSESDIIDVEFEEHEDTDDELK